MCSSNFFFVREGRRFIKIEIASILYIESQKNYSRIFLSARSFMISVPLKEMETLLADADFCRIHRSYIVNLAYLSSFDNSKATLAGRTLSIGESYRKTLAAKVTIVGAPNKAALTVC